MLREGLRLNVRHALVSLDGVEHAAGHGGWRGVSVNWRDGSSAAGWWRVEEPFVIVVLSDPPLGAPRRLQPVRPAQPVQPGQPLQPVQATGPLRVLRTLSPQPARRSLSPPPARRLLARTP